MVTKTIGTSGDFADIGLAWTWLTGIGLLTDNYTFNIISDFTENTGVSSSGPNFNKHTVSFLNNSNYTITSSGKYYTFLPGGSGASIDDILILDGLIINALSNGNILFANPWYASNGMTVYYKNIKIIGPSAITGSTFGIRLNRWANRDYLLNCIIYNCTYGIYCGIVDANTTGNTHIIENCAAYACGEGICLPFTSANQNVTIKNTEAAACVVRDFSTGGEHNIVTSCACSDETIATCGAIVTNSPIDDIVSGHFLSVSHTDNNFLKIGFTSPLYGVGTTNISAWNTQDYDNYARPGTDNLVSIGPFECEPSTIPADSKAIGDSLFLTVTTSFNAVILGGITDTVLGYEGLGIIEFLIHDQFQDYIA